MTVVTPHTSHSMIMTRLFCMVVSCWMRPLRSHQRRADPPRGGVWVPGGSLVRSSHAERPACLVRRRRGSGPGTLCRAWRDAGGEFGSPLARPGGLMRLKPVLLGHQEALRLGDHLKAV